MAGERWGRSETVRALYLYFQTPFGQIHSSNPEIVKLASAIGRTPSSIAMKLANFASLDPEVTTTGRRGLAGASALDRAVWAEFRQDWTKLIGEARQFEEWSDVSQSSPQAVAERRLDFVFKEYLGPSVSTVTIEQRVGQSFFRRAVLANYDVCCAITGIADSRLLNASHIVPWSTDRGNRHNPGNGLCLSATFDRAFDRGLITVLPSMKVKIARCLTAEAGPDTREFFAPYAGVKIRAAVRFSPEPQFLEWHNEHCFVDASP
jgi:putative restriction endonuclease